MNNYYIKSGKILQFDFELSEKYNVGSSYEDYNDGKFVKLSDEQVTFHETNPTAGITEVWNMKMNEYTEQEKTLEQAIQEKIFEIEQYDGSSSVNSFKVNDTSAWLDKDTRSNYKTSIDAAELLGEETISLLIAGNVISLTLTQAKTILAKIQRYADTCYLVTQSHIAGVKTLKTINEVDAYDIENGYPNKLTFTI